MKKVLSYGRPDLEMADPRRVVVAEQLLTAGWGYLVVGTLLVSFPVIDLMKGWGHRWLPSLGIAITSAYAAVYLSSGLLHVLGARRVRRGHSAWERALVWTAAVHAALLLFLVALPLMPTAGRLPAWMVVCIAGVIAWNGWAVWSLRKAAR